MNFDQSIVRCHLITGVVPAGVRFMQVVSIDAFWRVTVSSSTTIVHVTTLDNSAFNIINVNGYGHFALQDQSLGFYIGSSVVVIGGGPNPLILTMNQTTSISSWFVYDSDRSGFPDNC